MARTSATASPAKQLAGFIAKFSPAIAKEARAALTRMARLLPAGAVRMVYDNYNGLVVGFGPNERASDAVVSILVVAVHVTLCFIDDAPACRIRMDSCKAMAASCGTSGSRPRATWNARRSGHSSSRRLRAPSPRSHGAGRRA
jgi:hypothetical protein